MLGRFLRDVTALNHQPRTFRIFGPDEMLSNMVDAVFEVTSRQWDAHTVSASEHPHGLSDTDYDAVFTTDRPTSFAFTAILGWCTG